MTENEFEELLLCQVVPKLITVDDLTDKSDRTLIYGYTCDQDTYRHVHLRDAWHVYLKDGKIITLLYTWYLHTPLNVYPNTVDGIYGGDGEPCKYEYKIIDVKRNSNYIPDKCIDPESCDFEFCKLLKQAGQHLPFTGKPDDELQDLKYYGLVI